MNECVIRMGKRIKQYAESKLGFVERVVRWDWYFIVAALLAMFICIVLPSPQKVFLQILLFVIWMLFAVLGCIYIYYGCYLWFFKKAEFDWHLINGNFMRKVALLVLLMPFVLVSISSVLVRSPKELTYAPELYECQESGLACDIKQNQKSPNLFWSVYYLYIDPGNQHMTTTATGRVVAFVIAMLGVFLLNGLLVSSIIGWIDSRKEKWLKGNIRYKCKDFGAYKFAVVIGANEIAASVIKNLLTPKQNGEINYKCEGENDYVILQTSRDVEEVRVELASHLLANELKRVVIYKALRDSVSEIENLFIKDSTEIYVLGESTLIDGGETYHDAMNMRCVNLIVKELSKTYDIRNEEHKAGGKSVRKVCKVMFEYQTTSSIFLFSGVSEEINNNLVFIPFNRYESWAKAVIADNTAVEDCNERVKQIKYTPLDGDGGIPKDVDTHVHFVVVGMSKMGVAMGVQAMLQAHYLNFASAEMLDDSVKRVKQKDARRTRITFIDTNADKEMAFFKGRYENLFNLVRYRYVDANKCEQYKLAVDSWSWVDPMQGAFGKWTHLSEGGENFIDIEVEFIKGELESDGVRKYLQNISDNGNPWVEKSKLTIAICLVKVHQAIAASLYMPLSVYEKAQEIWVYQRESADIVLNLSNSGTKDRRYKMLKPFGMLYGDYMSDRTQYLRALLVNGAYDLDVMKDGKVIKKAEDRNMADRADYKDLRMSWRGLSLDKKFSNRYYVDSIQQKIRSINAVGLSADELKTTIDEHAEILARCEHNRWVVQQLLLGYSPCPYEIEKDVLGPLNAEYKLVNDVFKLWKKNVGWDNLTDKERKALETEQEYLANKTAKDAFKSKKEEYKEGESRIHPNICSYDHLDEVDFGAKNYDIYLNSIIPTIKKLIDDIIETNVSNNSNV